MSLESGAFFHIFPVRKESSGDPDFGTTNRQLPQKGGCSAVKNIHKYLFTFRGK